MDRKRRSWTEKPACFGGALQARQKSLHQRLRDRLVLISYQYSSVFHYIGSNNGEKDCEHLKRCSHTIPEFVVANQQL